MISCKQLVTYCDDLLQTEVFRDYCPNGLQIEGKETVNKVISGVTASQALIDLAVAQQADVLLVHHGFFWKGEQQPLVGIKKRRIKQLLQNDINLLAYHLPLDAHQQLGNNAVLAKKLGITTERFAAANNIVLLGHIEEQSGQQLSQLLATVLGREPQHIDASIPISRIALCTGAAQSYIEDAVAMGADAFISGEISENTFHYARENNIHYFAAGHHATERYGVEALGKHLAEQFDLQHQFIDVYNPV